MLSTTSYTGRSTGDSSNFVTSTLLAVYLLNSFALDLLDYRFSRLLLNFIKAILDFLYVLAANYETV